MAFARQRTKAAYAVTNAEFATLLEQFGPAQMTAAVHTVAFANLQNRIVPALGVKSEPGGPYPPLTVRLDPAHRAQPSAPARPAWDRVITTTPKKSNYAPADWKDVTFDQLETALAAQKARTARVPMPDPARFRSFPPDARQADTIVWMTVSTDYQPVPQHGPPAILGGCGAVAVL